MFKLRFILLVFLFLSVGSTGFSQSKKDEKMAKKAAEHFKKKDYLIAEKFYAQLVVKNPKNAEYNHKYGACILKTSDDKQDAVKYLSFAVKNSTEVGEAYYHYAKALQYTYRFKEALSNYNKFRAAITVGKANKLEVDALIKQCKTSLKLIDEFSPVKVISSKVMNRQRFEKAYRLGSMGRKILIKPIDFKTKEDFTIKKGDPQLIVHGQNQNTLFFSGYKYGNRFAILERDIFMVKKSEDGIWSNFLDVGPFINSDFDEDYPYLHPNGRELYFSSKGHGGLGGYDIFKSQLDTITGLWGRPVNLGFAVNSPFDDILYVVDGNDGVAYFSSNRANNSSEVTVYKIIASTKSDSYVLCKGKISVEGGKDNKVDIAVINAQGQKISQYSSDKKTGDFVFPLAELESYKLELSYDNKVVKSIKLMIPLKSSQAFVYHDIKFKVDGTPSILSKIDRNYELTEADKIASFQSLSKIEVNQKFDVKFGDELPSEEKNIEDITITDPEILLKNALAEKEELIAEKEDFNDQINAGYVVTHISTKKAINLNKELQQLVDEIDANSPENQQKITDKQKEYHAAIQKIVDVLLFVENQENTFLQKEEEEKISDEYIKTINSARSGEEIDLVDYRKQMLTSKEELNSKNQSKITELNKDIKKLKYKRNEIKSEQFKLKSDIALIKDAVQFLTNQMNKTKKEEYIAEYANKITSLEKEKKKKIPLLNEKQEELAAIDSLFTGKEEILKIYSEVDNYSAQPSMRRVNLSERETIAENAKITVNKSKLAGTLDEFIVKNVIIGSEQDQSGLASEFSGNDFLPSQEHLDNLFASNLSDANDQQIHQLSKDIFGIKNVENGDFKNEQIEQNDQLAANNFREALMMRQEIEKKKKQLAEATDEGIKNALREEIEILEAHLFKMEFEATVALTKSNDYRHKEKNNAIQLAFTLTPDVQTGEVTTLFDEANKEWDEVTMLKQRLANNNSQEQKSNISKEILNKQASAINKLMRIERIIKGLPADIEETVVSTDDLLNKETSTSTNPINIGDPTNPPENNFGRNTPKTKTNSTFEGVDIAQYGPNSTMRVKKGILITADIKYNINTKVPVDIPLGTGIIYKVQVGAFRNKINPEIFSGITPLSAEDAGNGIYRYTAGIFKSLTGANMAKGKIVEIGYADAFVVAFFNGRRISLTEAENVIDSSSEDQQKIYRIQKSDELAALEKAGIKKSDAQILRSSAPNPINSHQSLNVPNSRRITDNSTTRTNTKPNINTTTFGGASRSTNTSGIYYTVQIGVYSTKKTSSDLYGISPLVTHTNKRGLIRYSTGIFKTLKEASQRKLEARTQGAEDAYVAVYRDGVRISLEEAQGN